MAFGLQDEGFEIKRLNDIIAEKKEFATTLFQDLVAVNDTVDVSDESLLGRLVKLAAKSEAELWEQMLNVYGSQDPNSAYGVQLDNLLMLAGMERQGAKPSSCLAIFGATTTTTIPANSEVISKSTGKRYKTTEDIIATPTLASYIGISVNSVANNTLYTFSYQSSNSLSPAITISYTSPVSGSTQTIIENGLLSALNADSNFDASIASGVITVASVDPLLSRDYTVSSNLTIAKVYKQGLLTCVENGANEEPIGALGNISTPVIGWSSTYNPVPATVGRDVETDAEARARLLTRKANSGTGTTTSIYSAVSSLDTVLYTAVYENDTDVTDSRGLPPHSFSVVVDGGNSIDIASAIYSVKPAGVYAHGDTLVNVINSRGESCPVRFSRASSQNVYISLHIITDNNFPVDGVTQIKQNLISYINKLTIGQDVIYSRLFTPINNVAGFAIDTMLIGTTASLTSTSNISVSDVKKAFTQSDFISITIN